MRLLLPFALLAAACVAPGDRQAGSDYPDSLWTFQRVGANALVVRRGFRVEIVARDLVDARGLALGPAGEVFVTQRRPGIVTRIPAGGTAPASPLRRDLRHPHGIAFRGDTLWVAEEHQVIRSAPPYTLVDTVVRDLPSGAGHSTRTIAFRDNHLYVSVGSSCNLCDEADPRRAAILRYEIVDVRATHASPLLYATGLRNSVGLAVHPATGDLWATNNDRDRLGDDRPPDRVNHVVEGGWYGWPQCYLPDSANPEYADASCASARGPAITLGAHTAPLGLAFYTANAFPAGYRGGMFIALHGSWDRSFPVGYKIVFVPFADGQPAGPPEDFLVGWLAGRQFWGRPVDVLVMPDGALLVSDDESGRLYRVTWEGT